MSTLASTIVGLAHLERGGSRLMSVVVRMLVFTSLVDVFGSSDRCLESQCYANGRSDVELHDVVNLFAAR